MAKDPDLPASLVTDAASVCTTRCSAKPRRSTFCSTPSASTATWLAAFGKKQFDKQ